MLALSRWACTGLTSSLPLALVLAVTHSTLTLLLLRSDTRLNLGGAIGTFLLYSNSFFVLLHNFYTFCSMFFFSAAFLLLLLPMLCVFLCSLFFIATRDRGSSSSSPAMCNRPLQLPSLLQSLSSSPSPSPSPSMVCVDTNLLLFHSHSHPGQSISMWRKYLIFSPHFLISFFPSSSFLLFLFFVVFCFWAAFCLSFFPFRLFSVFFLFSCCTQFLPLHFYWLHLRRATAYMCVLVCVRGDK